MHSTCGSCKIIPFILYLQDLARASLAGFDYKDYDAVAGCFIKANAATKHVGQFYSATSTVEACAKACYEERTCLSFHHKDQVCKLSVNPELKTTSASTAIEYGGLCPKGKPYIQYSITCIFSQ